MIVIELTNKLAGKEGEVVRFEIPTALTGDVIIRIGGAEAAVDVADFSRFVEML